MRFGATALRLRQEGNRWHGLALAAGGYPALRDGNPLGFMHDCRECGAEDRRLGIRKVGESHRGALYCLSYSPLLTRFRTVKPAFLASEMESALGELNVEKTLRTGFLQAGQWVKGAAESGRRKVNRPPHTLQSPSQSSYS
jgi:hypothetical protein